MRLLSVSVSPNASAVEPTIELEVTYEFDVGRMAPLSVSVELMAEDKKGLGFGQAWFRGTQKESLNPHHWYDSPAPTSKATLKAVVPLTNRQIAHVDELRSRHRKGDAVMIAMLEVRFLTSRTQYAWLHTTRDSGNGQPTVVAYQAHTASNPFHPDRANLAVLSANDGAFLQHDSISQAHAITIRASDWIHDFCSLWQTKRYAVLELPQPQVTGSTSGVNERIQAGITAARDAESALAQGEWNTVIEKLRPVWELVKKDPGLEDLLKRDGYTEDASRALVASAQQQFTFASKFVHRVDPGGKALNPEIKASREDAILCHAFAVSLLNLVARKTHRLG